MGLVVRAWQHSDSGYDCCLQFWEGGDLHITFPDCKISHLTLIKCMRELGTTLLTQSRRQPAPRMPQSLCVCLLHVVSPNSLGRPMSKRCSNLSTCVLGKLSQELHKLQTYPRTNVGAGTPGKKRSVPESDRYSSYGEPLERIWAAAPPPFPPHVLPRCMWISPAWLPSEKPQLRLLTPLTLFSSLLIPLFRQRITK